MFSSQMTSVKVADVVDLNKVVKQLKEDSELSLRIQPIPEEDRGRCQLGQRQEWQNTSRSHACGVQQEFVDWCQSHDDCCAGGAPSFSVL